ncbi:N-acyl homoserine lactonase family protein [Cryobacterium sp. Y82]|uniref:N-acyl homoserine lactonase family protein n=1 Tax=Cryobacterium sp. Y82 TaxID=2045017 RepID=UPI000CE39096|nr:N-acyl homoserine lactonase family protein [Cryobacterium sp. Y82]
MHDTIPPSYRSVINREWRPSAVYAIRYATRPTALRREHFYGHDDCGDNLMPIDYFVWLIAGPGAAILVDAGFTPETALARHGREHLGSPLEVADKLGYPLESIPSVVVSHAHYDHTGYLPALSGARIHLQQKELAFWTGPHAKQQMYRDIVDEEDVVTIVRSNFAGGVDLYDGDAWIAPGVSAHLVGGHTAGTQVVRVALPSGEVVVIASDSSHFYENEGARRPFSIAHTVPTMFDAFDRLGQLALRADGGSGILLPGHDPAVKDLFPIALADDPTVAGRLWRIA